MSEIEMQKDDPQSSFLQAYLRFIPVSILSHFPRRKYRYLSVIKSRPTAHSHMALTQPNTNTMISNRW